MDQALVISADEIKKTLPGYQPNKSHIFHRESTKIADKEYASAVKKYNTIKRVILTRTVWKELNYPKKAHRKSAPTKRLFGVGDKNSTS
jgi:hypothetical protein